MQFTFVQARTRLEIRNVEWARDSRFGNSLTGAASRFKITPRELQVLALLLDGNHLSEIARQQYITSSTVQDDIKSMLGKTGSSNRSALIAHVSGWESTTSAELQ